MEDNGPRRSSTLDAEAFSVLVPVARGKKRRGLDFGWQGCGERSVAA